MTESLPAAAPGRNVTVRASAGTGKTWLLVTRLLRLLLEGCDPAGILAVTFTRKAAAEMQARLTERARDLLEATPAGLDARLTQIGLRPSDAHRSAARGLYERLLFSERGLRATTFHAFCQELLRRFPLEADVPPGFDLAEATGALERAAWDALYAEAARGPDSGLGQDLQTLFQLCGGLHNTRGALSGFLGHRGDWWAFTRGQADPAAFAGADLRQWLGVDEATDPAGDFFTADRAAAVAEVAGLLGRHPTKTNLAHQGLLTDSLDPDRPLSERLGALRQALLKADGTPRARPAGKSAMERLGEAGQQRLTELCDGLCADLEALAEHQARRLTLKRCTAWYRAGQRLLEHYQRLKREQRVLDFADLEWKAFQLLHSGDNVHWVQYKLDQRIDHLLVDEFQDTNPTQWGLLLPVLEELAAGDSGRARSVFLVGDEKQSIYRFRRADPRLFPAAARWLGRELAAEEHTLDASRRSAPAIIDAVNRIFAATTGPGSRLQGFGAHATHLDALWGRVEVLPLVGARSDEAGEDEIGTADTGEDTAALRNPLERPRLIREDLRHAREARRISDRIAELLAGGTRVGAPGEARPLGCGDIIILLRSRTHAQAYEQALREAGIPYLGAGRGTLLQALEVRDLEALLNLLIVPFDNLALAQVLRSPLFDASDRDLMDLAGGQGPWIERLTTVADERPPDSPLHRASRALDTWRRLAGQVPVHDLLDAIFHQGDVPARYEAAFPASLQPRVRANLVRFLELALEVDAGRYPSLPRFLNRLEELREQEEAPDEAAPEGQDRVRIMTVHAAKGLEAPVIFLADAGPRREPARAFQTVVDWPAGAGSPRRMLLAGRRAEMDRASAGLLEQTDQADAREEANLLYVALTRARQLLFVSGCAPAQARQSGPDVGWYAAVRAALTEEPDTDDPELDAVVLESGTMPDPVATPPSPPPAPPAAPAGLDRPLQAPAAAPSLAPSRTTLPAGEGAEEGAARRRGNLVHRFMELRTREPTADGPTLLRQVAAEFDTRPDNPGLRSAWQEARAAAETHAFQALFAPAPGRTLHAEVPIHYRSGANTVHGVIDLLAVDDAEVRLVDYKSHRPGEADTAQAMAERFRGQLRVYVQGVQRLWPGRAVRAFVLLTACRELVEVNVGTPPPA